MKTVIYCRVATKKQSDKFNSLESQQRQLEEYCKMQGYTIVATFLEVASGNNFERIEFQKMLEFLKERKADLVIAMSMDRFSRNIMAYKAFEANLANWGVKVGYPSKTDEYSDLFQISQVAPGVHGITINPKYKMTPAEIKYLLKSSRK
jgi:DNA invertase Pin-like site-specific DNA recombinase